MMPLILILSILWVMIIANLIPCILLLRTLRVIHKSGQARVLVFPLAPEYNLLNLGALGSLFFICLAKYTEGLDAVLIWLVPMITIPLAVWLAVARWRKHRSFYGYSRLEKVQATKMSDLMLRKLYALDGSSLVIYRPLGSDSAAGQVEPLQQFSPVKVWLQLVGADLLAMAIILSLSIVMWFVVPIAYPEKPNIPTYIQSVLIYRYGYEDFEVVDLSKPYREITDQKTIGAVYACLTKTAASEKAYIQWGDDLVILVRSTSGKILHVAISGRGLKKSLLSPMHFTQDSLTVTIGGPLERGRWIEVEGEWLSQLVKHSDEELFRQRKDEKDSKLLK